MKKKGRLFEHKTPAQTMVEFALVLPILLAVVFGLFEVGRMVFTYVTIISASREAVRYGSATGLTNGGVLRYKDCPGIRAAAENVNFLKTFSDSNIIITYDHGLTSGGAPIPWSEPNCTKGSENWPPNLTVTTTDRINVSVTGTFVPIINFINLLSLGTAGTSADEITLGSENSHTILGNVPIEKPWVPLFTPTGGGGGGGGGGHLATATATLTPTPVVLPTSTTPPTRTPIPCQISATKPQVNQFYTELQWSITTNTAVTINNMHVSWPAGSGNLMSVTIDANPPVTIDLPAPSTDITGAQLSPYQNLAIGTHTFIFKFNNNPLGGVFQVSLAFTDPTCSPISGALTLYPVTHSGNFPNANGSSFVAGPWTIYNHTNKVLYVNYIQITWNGASDCFSTADLTQVHLAANTSNVLVPRSSCLGYNLIPVDWTIPIGNSTMDLTFNLKGVRNITVQIGLTGKINSPESYILDSTNPNQKQ